MARYAKKIVMNENDRENTRSMIRDALLTKTKAELIRDFKQARENIIVMVQENRSNFAHTCNRVKLNASKGIIKARIDGHYTIESYLTENGVAYINAVDANRYRIGMVNDIIRLIKEVRV